MDATTLAIIAMVLGASSLAVSLTTRKTSMSAAADIKSHLDSFTAKLTTSLSGMATTIQGLRDSLAKVTAQDATDVANSISPADAANLVAQIDTLTAQLDAANAVVAGPVTAQGAPAPATPAV